MGYTVRTMSVGAVFAVLGAAGWPLRDAAAQSANTAVVEALTAEPTGTAQRAAFYAEVARADGRALDAFLERAAEIKDPATKSFALEVLLTRYAELDPGGAVAAANKLGPSAPSSVPLYQAWLHSSPAAALAAIAKLGESQASSIIPGLLARVEGDQELVAEILAAAPRSVADRYVASSILRLAQESPREALGRAQEIADPGARTDTINGVLRTWAARNPRSFLDYVATLEETARRSAINGSWYQIASSEPELALDRADLFPPELRTSIAGVAIPAIAQRDPLAAYARAQQMPQGQERRQVVRQIAQTFAQRDTDGALAWARSLQPPEPEVLVAVVTGIGSKDPLRALDLAATIGTPMERQQAMDQVVMFATIRDPSLASTLLERVLASPNDAQKQSLSQTIVTQWAGKEPARAADWVIANADRAPAGAVTELGSAYARRDLQQALSYATRMPSQIRGAWLRGVAAQYAANDPHGALEWVQQFNGSPDYDETAFAVIMPLMRVDPEAAARAAESLGRDDYRRSVIMQSASAWAQRDPAAAASWAAGLKDVTSRQAATSITANVWSAQDPAAAQAFLLNQPSGPARDGALLSLISGAARQSIPDDSLLAGFSDERARTAAVQGAAFFISQRDPSAARAFVEAHVADAAQRERILAFLSQQPAPRGALATGVPGAFSIAPGGLVPGGMPIVRCGPGSAGPCVPGALMPAGPPGGLAPDLAPGQALPSAQGPPVGQAPTPAQSRPPRIVDVHPGAAGPAARPAQ